MKNNRIPLFPFAFLAAGLLAAFLRARLFSAANEWGLLPEEPVTDILLWLLTAAAAAGAVVLGKKRGIAPPADALDGILLLPLPAAILLLLLQNQDIRIPVLLWACRITAIAGAAGFAAMAVMLIAGKKPAFGCYAAPCLFLCVQLVVSYQSWSNMPQFQNFIFGLGAQLCMIFFAYHRASALAGNAPRRSSAAVGLLGIYFCVAASAASELLPLYAAGTVWLTIETSRLLPKEEKE